MAEIEDARNQLPEVIKVQQRYHDDLALLQVDKKGYEIDYSEEFNTYIKTRPLELLGPNGINLEMFSNISELTRRNKIKDRKERLKDELDEIDETLK